MGNLQDILNKRKMSQQDLGMKFLVSDIAEKVATSTLEDMKPAITEHITNLVKAKLSEEIEDIKKGVQQIQKGRDGYTPIKGQDYFDGKDAEDVDEEKVIETILSKIELPENGKDGIDADEEAIISKVMSAIPIPENGKDGSPDTAEEIISKINTTEDLIEQKTIKGLEKLIDGLYKAMQSLKSSISSAKGGGAVGGGGMGNVQHESKSVSTATTTITTDFNIAGGGFAIWAYYQGQLIARGTHYTVSGRTLTLTFTPDNSTTIDLIYIRG